MGKEVTVGRQLPFWEFYFHKTDTFKSSIWEDLKDGLWKDFNIDNYLYNEQRGDDKPEEWRPVFTDVTPVYEGFKWDALRKCLTHDYYTPKRLDRVGMDTFLDTAEHFFRRYDGKRIGVHLSGGLDSTLIIALLRYFHIPFVLVGLKSDRFEMRTERRIQEIISGWGENTCLLEISDYPFFSQLENVPKHQVPCEFFRGNTADKALAQAFRREGVDIVFTGQGGDSLFMEDETKGLARYNIGYEFMMSWAAEFHYKPLGIELVSPLADHDIINQISNLRIGQPEDSSKLWIRHFFKDFLPRELSEYHYVADFFGHTLDGLSQAKQTTKLLFEESYELTRHHVFSPRETRRLMQTDVYAFEIEDYLDYCSRISVAVWLHSLFRINEV